MLSFSVRRIASPTKKPLLRMLRWVSVAPLGLPVVPEVNWMLIGSSAFNVAPSAASRSFSASDGGVSNSPKLDMPGVFSSPRRMTNCSVGSFAAFNAPGWDEASSGARSLIISM